jgi:hypothetical protein
MAAKLAAMARLARRVILIVSDIGLSGMDGCHAGRAERDAATSLCQRGRTGSKRFFFEKKNQKTFNPFAR